MVIPWAIAAILPRPPFGYLPGVPRRCSPAPAGPCFEVVLEAFGPERPCVGSAWSTVGEQVLRPRPTREREAVWGSATTAACGLPS